MNSILSPRVKKVSAENNFCLILSFENGEEKIFDVKPFLDFEVYRALKDETFFRLARPSFGTVSWNDEIDFDPDRLYLDSVPRKDS